MPELGMPRPLPHREPDLAHPSSCTHRVPCLGCLSVEPFTTRLKTAREPAVTPLSTSCLVPQLSRATDEYVVVDSAWVIWLREPDDFRLQTIRLGSTHLPT